METLTAKSLARADPPPPTAAAATSAAAAVAAAERDAATARDRGDDLVALLRALSGCYEAHPQLWLDPELR